MRTLTGDKKEAPREETFNGWEPRKEVIKKMGPMRMGLRAGTTKETVDKEEATIGAETKGDEEMETRRLGVKVLGLYLWANKVETRREGANKRGSRELYKELKHKQGDKGWEQIEVALRALPMKMGIIAPGLKELGS